MTPDPRKPAAVLLAAALFAASTPSPGAPPAKRAPPHGHPERDGGPAQIHAHTAGAGAMHANAYLIEANDGVIAVDGSSGGEGAQRLRDKLDRLKKPLLAVLVTHGHADHVDGIAALIAGQPSPVPVVATGDVASEIESLQKARASVGGSIGGGQAPKTVVPDRLVKDGESIAFGGVIFTAHDFGPGEAGAATVWVLRTRRPSAFVGDLVMHKVHAVLANGRSHAWLVQLEKAKRLLFGVERIFPGHGQPGGSGSLEWQRSYLAAYRAAVGELSEGRDRLGDRGKEELTKRMEAFLPGAPLADLVGSGADAVAAELASEKRQVAAPPKPAQ